MVNLALVGGQCLRDPKRKDTGNQIAAAEVLNSDEVSRCSSIVNPLSPRQPQQMKQTIEEEDHAADLVEVLHRSSSTSPMVQNLHNVRGAADDTIWAG